MSSQQNHESKKQAELFADEGRIISAAKRKEPTIRYSDKPEKTIRIAVSGDVVLTKLEVKIIDTKAFQRLRKHRQLGTSYLIYPSANHTRFEHSLGVLKKTQEMIEFIQNNFHSLPEEKEITHIQKRIARLAALLHDIANIPFGHTLEDETHVIQSYQEDKDRIEAYLATDTEIGDILRQDLDQSEYDLLIRVLSSKKDPQQNQKEEGSIYISDLGNDAFMVDLIKNTVCADLLDYLERDTYFCNLPLAVPDRFLRYLYLQKTSEGKRLAIRLWKKGDAHPRGSIISELIQLLEIRYFLAERVYFHHAKEISSAMVAAAIWHGMHQDKGSLTYRRLEELGDDELLSELQDDRRFPIASKLASALGTRNLYKRFYLVTRDQIESNKLYDQLDHLKTEYHLNAHNRTSTELSLCNLGGIEHGDIVIYCPDPKMNFKVAEMNVTSRRDGIEPLYKTDNKLSKAKIESIIDSHRNLWALQVFVHPKAIDSQYKRDLLLDWCRAYFEELPTVDGDRCVRHAIRSTIDDIMRESHKSVNVSEIDQIVQEASAANRSKGDAITREYLMSRIDEMSEQKKKSR